MRRRKRNAKRKVNIDNSDPANIVVFPASDKHVKSPQMMEALKITHPFGWLNIGMTGSGKSLLALNIVDHPNMFKGFFDVIYLFSRTSRADDTYDRLDIDKRNIFSGKDEEMIKDLRKIIDKHTKEVEHKGKIKSRRPLIIVEDATSLKKFMRSAPFAEAFTQSRHFNGSCIVNAHKYKAVSNVARLNAHYISIFKSSNAEKEVIAEDYAPQDKKAFKKLLDLAWKPDKRNPKPFFFINRKDDDHRFRKTLDLSLSQFLETEPHV